MGKIMMLLMMLVSGLLPLSAQQTFVNPLFRGADPWVVRDEASKSYLWCFSEGDLGVALYRSKSLTDRGEKTVVWRAPKEGPYSQQIWAPELHFAEGRWYIYMAGSDGKNENHLAYVLRAKTDDVMGEYEVLGPRALLGICAWVIEQPVPLKKRFPRRSVQFVNHLVTIAKPATIGDELRRCRLLRKLSQKDVAALFGIHFNTVSKWELGVEKPTKKLRPMVEQWIRTGKPPKGT